MIEININVVFTIINLIVLYLLMKKFLFGPILNVMEQRKNMIDQQFASAKDTEEQAYELKGKYEDALKSANCWSIMFFLCSITLRIGPNKNFFIKR